MAKKNEARVYLKNGKEYTGVLPLHTQVEVVKIKDGVVKKKIMSLDDALCLKKEPGWTYHNFEPGFAQYKQQNDADTI